MWVDFQPWIEYNIDNGRRRDDFMWLLFIIILLNGEQAVKYQAFKTETDCLNQKAGLTAAITATFPSSQASLTCVKINELGRVS